MGKTSYATGDAETQKLWDEKLFRDVQKESFFSKFTSMDGSQIVHEKTDLSKKQGDNITVLLRVRGNRSFLTSGTPVEGNEGSLTTYTDSVTIDEKNFGIRDAGMINRQRPVYDMDSETKRAIVEDGAEAVDKEFFTALDSANTSILYEAAGVFSETATLGTATLAVTAVDKLDPAFITKAKTWALYNRADTRVPLRPVRIEGKDYLVLLCAPDALADLKLDATYSQALREAELRGKTNPLFTGAVGVWDGVIVHEHENISTSTTGGASSDVPYAKCHLLGAQAIISAWAQKPTIVKEMFSYGQEHGYAFLSMWGLAKTQFNSQDYGSVNLIVARSQIVDV